MAKAAQCSIHFRVAPLAVRKAPYRVEYILISASCGRGLVHLTLPLFLTLYLSLSLSLSLSGGRMSDKCPAICPRQQRCLIFRPCGAFPFRFGRGLTDHQLDVGHIKRSAVIKLLHKLCWKDGCAVPPSRFGDGSAWLSSGRYRGYARQAAICRHFSEILKLQLQEDIGIQNPVFHVLNN